ncbi:dephospho-CoA kinase [Desulfovibrio sp. OttesenSCG-928-G15]|nr:dephospho-CoA kinase [Desulfovibrio sp. OttesenSCG-928-G15]
MARGEDIPAGNSASRRFCFTVEPEEQGMRLDRFLAVKLEEHAISREKVKRLLKDGRAGVEGGQECSPKMPVCAGSTVFALLPESRTGLLPEEGELRVVYRDSSLAVINKAAGLTVHPAPGLESGTLAHILLAHFPELSAQEGFRPGIVHRLDKDTSGLMLVALEERTRLALSAMFARHEVYKEYLALVRGVPGKAEEEIDAPIGRHPTRKTLMAVVASGKTARSRRRTLAGGQGFSLEAIRIFSGRTHQVRVHMQHVGHPLWGDAGYGPKLPRKTPKLLRKTPTDEPCRESVSCHENSPCVVAGRQMLHAWKLSFTHPFPENIPDSLPEGVRREGDTLFFCCPPPADFTSAVKALVYRPLRVVITGSPGCGKSSLLAWFHQAGYPTFSADAEIATMYEPGQDGWQLLRSYFGERFVPSDDTPVDKRALGKAMQEDAGVRKEVEALMHPLVRHRLDAFWQRHDGLAVAEIPLYLETGGKKTPRNGAELDAPVLVGVYASFPVREKRLRENRQWSDETIALMESWQWPELMKMRASNLVVNNGGTREELALRAKKLLRQLERLAARREEKALRVFQNSWSCRSREAFQG